jgi:hypothetical protein
MYMGAQVSGRGTNRGLEFSRFCVRILSLYASLDPCAGLYHIHYTLLYMTRFDNLRALKDSQEMRTRNRRLTLCLEIAPISSSVPAGLHNVVIQPADPCYREAQSQIHQHGMSKYCLSGCER